MEDGRLLSTGEVAKMLDVSQSTVANYIIKGILTPDITMPSSRTGKSGRRKFKVSTVQALKKSLQDGGKG